MPARVGSPDCGSFAGASAGASRRQQRTLTVGRSRRMRLVDGVVVRRVRRVLNPRRIVDQLLQPGRALADVVH